MPAADFARDRPIYATLSLHVDLISFAVELPEAQRYARQRQVCRKSILAVFPRQEAPAISLAPAIRLFHHRWSVPIVATLYRDGPLTFASLSGRLAASRDTLADTLAKLETNGVVERQRPGKRTMYVLTPLGQRVGARCLPMVAVVSETGVVEVALKKWPMLVLTALGRGARRYNEAKAALPGITARALAIALKDLQAAGLIDRTVDQGYPPAPLYVVSELGEKLFPALDDLCNAAEPVPEDAATTLGEASTPESAGELAAAET